MTDRELLSRDLADWRLNGWGVGVAAEGDGAIVLRSLNDGAIGVLERALDAGPWRGKRVRYSASVRTADVSGHAGLIARACGSGEEVLACADMLGRSPDGTTDATAHSVVVSVPPDAVTLRIGVERAGPGTVWLGDLEVVETSDAETPRHEPDVSAVPDTPAGRQLRWLLTAIAGRCAGLTPDDASERFTSNALRRGYPQLLRSLHSLALELQPFDVAGAESARPTRARARLRAGDRERALTVTVEPAAPHRIVSYQSGAGGTGRRQRPQLSKRGRGARNKLIRTVVGDAARGLLKPFRKRSKAGIVTSADDRRAEIAAVTTRIGVRMGTASLRTRRGDAGKREEVMERAAERSAEDLFKVMGSMKGAMMKVAQFASYTVEGLPTAMEQELSKLQQAAPPMSPELVAEVIASELGGPPDKVFASFDAEPLASASVGQVHRATTRAGLDVAVKVQYPGVDQAIRADLQNAEMFMTSAAGMFGEGADPRPMLNEIMARATEELDYGTEASNQRRFAERYRGHPLAKVPEVVDELSTTRVLTTELVRGRRFYDVTSDPQDVRNRLGKIMYRFAIQSVFVDGIFSGDPHPGNYIFMDDGRVCFLDYGMVKRLERDEVALVRAPVESMLAGDRSGFTETMQRRLLGVTDGEPVDASGVWRLYSGLFGRSMSDLPIRFTRSGLQDSLQRTAGAPGQQQASMGFAPSLGVFTRYMFGTHAVLAHLEAEGNWHRILRELLLGDAPTDEIGRAWAAA